MNPVAGIFAKLHAGSKTFVFVKESTQTILVEPTKVLRKEIWGPPFKVKIGLVPFAGKNINAHQKLSQQIKTYELFEANAITLSEILKQPPQIQDFMIPANLEKLSMNVALNEAHEKVLRSCKMTPESVAESNTQYIDC